MKLISLYIENFGCLHEFHLELDGGLTVLQEANGFGKTTLAEFIRAMFYGFPRAAKTLDKNKRKKYLPWNGGKCGGNLSFEWEGRSFRIERFFGATPKGDTFQLLDLQTNQKSDCFTENIGLELFGLDADSFERSTYLPQLQEAGNLSTDSIRAKLGDLVEDTNDINNYDKAVAALKNKRSTYIPYRGSGGAVAEARSQISRIQEALDDAQKKRDTLVSIQEDIEREEGAHSGADRELPDVRRKITQASQAQAVQALQRQYQGFLERQQTLQAAQEDGIFARGIPGDDEFDEAQTLCEAYLSTCASLSGTELSDGDRTQLQELEAFFAPGVPNDEMLESLFDAIQQYRSQYLRRENQALSQPEQAQLEALEREFPNGVPTEAELEAVRAKKDRAALLGQIPCPKRPSWGPALALGGLGLALAVAALAMIVLHIQWGGAVLAVAAALIAVAVVLAQKSGREEKAREAGRKAQSEAQMLEREVRDFTTRWGGDPENLSRMDADRIAFLSLQNRRDALLRAQSQMQQELTACRNHLEEALRPYWGEVQDVERAVSGLEQKCRQYRELLTRRNAQQARRAELTAQVCDLKNKLAAFLEKYGQPADETRFQSQLAKLRTARDAYLVRRNELEDLHRQMEQFRREHGEALERAPEETWDLEVLKRREAELTAEISHRTRKILEQKQKAAQLREALDRIPELQDELENWKMCRDGGQANADTLDATLVYLEQARESLSGNYLGTIQRSFEGYQKRLLEGEKALVTSDLEVCLERQGQIRELGYFSAGQTDLVMLCMRLALVDALFTGTKPFVILDDPFVNLDDAHTAMALKMLHELARDRQILYLVCNSSRV